MHTCTAASRKGTAVPYGSISITSKFFNGSLFSYINIVASLFSIETFFSSYTLFEIKLSRAASVAVLHKSFIVIVEIPGTSFRYLIERSPVAAKPSNTVIPI